MQIPDFITPGQIWAIVGESDSGHSALLAAMETKDAERVSFRHQFRNLSNTTDFYYQQRFNSSDSEDALTVHDHLQTLSTVKGYWDLRKLIGRLHLEPLMEEQLIKLSNGETKRLLIASALIKNPKILLLDHPLTGLDVSTRMEFNTLVEDISTRGTIVVIATSPSEVPAAVSHVAVVKNGEMVHHGEKKDFDPAQFGFTHDVRIDEKALSRLLSYENNPPYHFIVRMKNVTVKYDGRTILDNINWEIRQGERWSLSGPNGAGKSTLLSLINGDNPQAYANDIILFDKQRGSGESIWDIKKQTGFVSPELYQYFPTDSSCLQVIESGFYDTVGLFRISESGKSGRCLQWMELMNIGKYSRTLFNQVPPAVQRLCLLARALIKSPALLILDEPTQGLDNYQQLFFTELINRICVQSNVTLIYVSHYREHIPAAVNRHIEIIKGRIENRA